MNESELQTLYTVSARPIHFFPLEIECRRLPKNKQLDHRYTLFKTDQLCKEESFADVKLGWSQEGIGADVLVRAQMEHTLFPEVHLGDGIELFFDTRDRKSAGFNTRFCHHFGFVPKEADGKTACELTRFRTEDAHELCSPSDLLTKTEIKNKSYRMQIFIPSHCLYGFDPQQFDRLGFTYRISRVGKPAQHFQLSSDEFAIDQQPAYWSTLKLVQ